MRSDAKASTAGSTQRQAGGLGRIFRGAFATADGSFRVKGSSAPAVKRLALPTGVFAAILALVIVAGSASAANGVVNFFGGEGATGGKFGFENSGPGGVAVNQEGTGGATAGDVYVVDRGNNRIQQFTAAGAFVRAFGLNVGGAGVHVCTVAASCVGGTASAEAGGMSNPQGIAIDQTNGNVYVIDQNNRRVDVFSANGTFQAAFGYGVDTGGAALELCTPASTCAAGTSGANAGQFGAQIGYLAVAPAGSSNAGHVYVANKSNRRVDQFEPTLTAGEVTGIAFVKGWGWGVDTGASEFQQCTTASVCQAPNTSSPTSNPGQFGSNQPQALAVDSNGNIYTVESEGNNRAQKFDPTGNPVAFSATELTGSPGPNDIAVDKTNNRVFAIKEVSGTGEKRVLEFNATGAFIATHASGTTITSANGLAVVQGTTNFYVSTSQTEAFRGVFFLGDKVAPTAVAEAPSSLEAHSATLKGKVNPQGFATGYHFEFSRDKGKTWENIPTNDISLGNGTSELPVEAEVGGLIGAHQYRYRILATKAFGAGTATSNQTTFTTPASPPTISATFISAVTTTTAVLEAEINPNNEATTYHFEYGAEDCALSVCTSIPLSGIGVGSGETPIKVHKEISGLTPDETYHFRVVATNGSGTTEGSDRIFSTYASETPDTTCSNQAFRVGAAAYLPDCRAYEMVSPVNKNGSSISTLPSLTAFDTGFTQSATSGDKITYSSYAAFGDAVAAQYTSQYIASRTATGWSTHGISPPRGREKTIGITLQSAWELDGAFKAFTDDLSKAWLFDFAKPTLTPDAVQTRINLFGRDNTTDSYHALTVGNAPTIANSDKGYQMEVKGFSADGSHLVFDAAAALTPDAAANTNAQVYDFTEGELHLVSVLPDGTADPGKSAAGSSEGGAHLGRFSTVNHAVSDDGSRIFWTSAGISIGELFVRIDGVETVSISGFTPRPNEARFLTASASGSKVAFSLGLPLGRPGDELYEFDVETKTPTLIANETYGVLGASDDLSRLYFVSGEALDAGATASEPNLYLHHKGEDTFIATLSKDEVVADEMSITSLEPINHVSSVTPDGRHAAFQSSRSLTGYDNTDAVTGEPVIEVFIYDADSGQLSCASCNPSGARPVGGGLKALHKQNIKSEGIRTAAWLATPESQLAVTRHLSDDGNRLFFNSFDALIPRDTNGKQDVYQWEAHGSGTCQRSGGCVSLISSGASPVHSEFVDTSPDGRDVFFKTQSSLVVEDAAFVDIYDARVGGGFAQPAPGAIPCIGDACQAIPPAPNDLTPASAGFRGAENPIPARECSSVAKHAARLGRLVRILRAKSKHAAGAHAERLRHRSVRVARNAEELRKSASRCRRANRGAAR